MRPMATKPGKLVDFDQKPQADIAPHQRDIWLPHLIRLWLRSHHSQSHLTIRSKSHMASCEVIFTSTRLMTTIFDRVVTSFVTISRPL